METQAGLCFPRANLLMFKEPKNLEPCWIRPEVVHLVQHLDLTKGATW